MSLKKGRKNILKRLRNDEQYHVIETAEGKLRNNRWELSVDYHTQVSCTHKFGSILPSSGAFFLFHPKEIFLTIAFKFTLSESR